MGHLEVKEELLRQAKKRQISASDVKILSTDPFFVGSDTDYANAQWAANLWDKMMARRKKPLHLRGFHYWVQSQGIAKPDGVKYAHVDPAKDWTFLLKAAQLARYLGLGEWKGLVDLKHPEPIDYDNYWVGSGLEKTGEVDIQGALDGKLEGLVDEFIGELLRESPRYHNEGYQMYHQEVWVEKNSMGAFINPVCKRYDACYQPLIGQSSVEKVNLAAMRAVRAAGVGKKVRIYYIADFDRYGWSMVSAVARKIEFMMLQQGLIDKDVKLTRLALNEDHIAKFNLPKAPKHGEAVVELDALEAIHPGELGKIVEAALAPYYDTESPKIVDAENRRIRDVVRKELEEKLREPLKEAFKEVDITTLAGDIDLENAIDPDFEVPEPGHVIDDSGDRTWMYDSKRSYWSQWEAYRAYKCERVEEEA